MVQLLLHFETRKRKHTHTRNKRVLSTKQFYGGFVGFVKADANGETLTLLNDLSHVSVFLLVITASQLGKSNNCSINLIYVFI